MIELFDDKLKMPDRQSSKGNQLKWEQDGVWYKADYAGYEGLAECVVCHMLKSSSLDNSEFAIYSPERIRYKKSIFNGVSTKSVLFDDWQIITLERLFKSIYSESLTKSIWKIHDVDERLDFLVSSVEKMTGLHSFGEYLTKILSIDAFFLNEDRHMHNIAVLVNGQGRYEYCPIFDHGASLLSDTTIDYPLGEDIMTLINSAEGKTICSDFDEALDAAEKKYGNPLQFNINKSEIMDYIDGIDLYEKEVRDRVKEIVRIQIRKYSYMINN